MTLDVTAIADAITSWQDATVACVLLVCVAGLAAFAIWRWTR